MSTLDRSKLGDEQVFVSPGSHQVVPSLSSNTVAEAGLCSFWQFLGSLAGSLPAWTFPGSSCLSTRPRQGECLLLRSPLGEMGDSLLSGLSCFVQP